MSGITAGRMLADFAEVVFATLRTETEAAFYVGDDFRFNNGIARRTVVFRRPRFDSAVKLAKIIDAGRISGRRADARANKEVRISVESAERDDHQKYDIFE